MRVVVLAVLLISAPARADSRSTVEGLLKTLLLHTSEPARIAPTLRSDTIVVFDDTIARNATADDAATYFSSFAIKSTGAIKIEVDDKRHAAWFETVAAANTLDQAGDSCTSDKPCAAIKFKMHISGLALDEGGWKLAVIVLSMTVSDYELGQRAKQPGFESAPMPTQVATSGDSSLAAAVQDWIAGAKLGKTSASGTVYALGTAPDEIATAGAAAKLAAKWDKLKLAPNRIEAKALGGGAFGFAYAEVMWPVKPDMVFRLRFGTIAVREGNDWRWLTLDFSPPFW